MLFSAALVLGLAATATEQFSSVEPFFRDSVFRPNAQDSLIESYTRPEISDIYRQIGLYAPRALLVVDSESLGWFRDTDEAALRPEFIYALGAAAAVREANLSRVEFPTGNVLRSGTTATGFRGEAWDARAPWVFQHDERMGRPDTLLVAGRNGTLHITDARLMAVCPEECSPAPPRNRTVAWTPTGWLVDGTLAIFLLLAGGMLTPRGVLSPPARAVLSLPVGIATLSAVSLARLPTAGSLAAVATVSLAGWSWARRQGAATTWNRAEGSWLAGMAVGSFVTAIWARTKGFGWVTYDSVEYLAQAHELAAGRLTLDLVTANRGLAQQQLHSIGFHLGVGGFESIGALSLLLVILLVLLLPALELMPRHEANSARLFAASGLCAALAAAPALVIVAAVVNSHSLVSALTLSLVVLLGLSARRTPEPNGSIVPAAGLLLTSIVLLRPEGMILAALVLLGTLRAGFWYGDLWRCLGFASIAWHGVLFRSYLERGEQPALFVFIMLFIGFMLTVAPSVFSRLPFEAVRAFPALVGAALWMAMLLLLWAAGDRISFLAAQTANIAEGRGGWGIFGILMVLLAILVVGLPEETTDGFGLLAARWTLIGYVPLTFFAKLGDGLQQGPDSVFAALLDGGGRIGWGDSVNRMWTHVIPLILAIIVMRLVSSGPVAEPRAQFNEQSTGTLSP